MKWFRFIFLLLKNGSLISNPLDFEKRRKQVFESAPVKPKPEKKNIYTFWRRKFAQNKYTGAFVSALAYVKKVNSIHRQYFVVDELRLVYVRLFKSGSTSMLRQLLPVIDAGLANKNLNDKQIDELSSQYVQSCCNKQQRRYVYFAIVRNPFHRLVSAYLDLFDSKNPFFSYQAYFFGIIKKKMTFAEFVFTISQIPGKVKSPHFVSQFDAISLCGGTEKIKCYRMDKDMAALTSFLADYNLTFNHANKNKTDYDYRNFYSLQTAQVVYDMYKMDVSEFGYEEEYGALLGYLVKAGNKNASVD